MCINKNSRFTFYSNLTQYISHNQFNSGCVYMRLHNKVFIFYIRDRTIRHRRGIFFLQHKGDRCYKILVVKKRSG